VSFDKSEVANPDGARSLAFIISFSCRIFRLFVSRRR
jgi:hypothetical protein